MRDAAWLLALGLLCAFSGADAKDPKRYRCSQKCGKADYNYEIGVEIRPTRIKGSNLVYVSRQITGEDEAPDWILGPTLKARPGKSFTVRIANKINPAESKLLGPPPPNRTDYVWEADPVDGPYSAAIPYGFDFVGEQPDAANDMSIVGNNRAYDINIPHSFDSTNIHFHGLTIKPHLFEPIGTSSAKADFIKISPGDCYCYGPFHLPPDHPDGTFWYHIHHHGSAALQSWSGMAGLFIVSGKTDEVLESYSKKQMQASIPFVIWDPHTVPMENGSWTLVGGKKAADAYKKNKNKDYIKVGDFLADQNDRDDAYTLVNNAINANFTSVAGQTMHFRVLCATTEALCMFRVVDKDGKPQLFYDFASDGITQSEATKREQIVQGGGYRDDVLLQIKEPGEYYFIQQAFEHMQFFGMGPPNLTLATLTVKPAPKNYPKPIDIEGDLLPRLAAVAPFKGDSIKKSEITKKREYTFSLTGNMSQVPFPQFLINERPFRIDYISFDQFPGVAEEWILKNPNFTAHPFHIHVFPFQVKHVKSTLNKVYPDVVETPAQKENFVSLTTDAWKTEPDGDAYNQWRDTIIIPAYGEVKVWIRFPHLPKKYDLNGKTVFHCHFLPHEDTGMITSWRIHDDFGN